MSHWNYRIVKSRVGRTHALHEVYYDDKGLPWAMNENPAMFVSFGDEEGPEDIAAALELALKDARTRPVLEEPERGKWPGKAL